MQEPIYQIDNIKITRITETVLTLPQHVLFPNAPIQLDTLQTSAPLKLSIHIWLIQLNGKNIMIDTGIGNFKPRAFSQLFNQLENPFLERLAQVGIHPDDINMVLLTHLHTDHIGWNTVKQNNQWIPTFKNATYYAPQKDLEFFFKPEGEKRKMLFEDSILPLIISNQLYVIPETGLQLTDYIRFEPTPGHCEGHMAIRFTTENHNLLFTGDIMHNELQVTLSDLSSTFCFDTEQANQTRNQMINEAVSNQTLLFPAHFRENSAGKIKEDIYGKKVWIPIDPNHFIEVIS